MPEKILFKPVPILYPVPAVLVSCGSDASEYNIITISWTGTINSDPPMLSISVRPERHSHSIIKKNGEFVVNLPGIDMAKATDWCGIRSGRDVNKFSQTGLTAGVGKVVNAPIILEAPVNIECKVKQIISLGSHDMFVSEVVAVQLSPEIYGADSNSIQWEKFETLCYLGGKYFSLGNIIGKSGFSIK